MWIFTSNSFVSIVQHRDAPEILCVRGRFAGDAAHFLGLPPDAEEITPAADYRFRCYAHRAHVMEALAQAAQDVDYPNFKDSIREKWRAKVALEVWGALWRAQAQRWREQCHPTGNELARVSLEPEPTHVREWLASGIAADQACPPRWSELGDDA